MATFIPKRRERGANLHKIDRALRRGIAFVWIAFVVWMLAMALGRAP